MADDSSQQKRKYGPREKWNPDEWLEVFRLTGDVGRASEAVGITSRNAYYKRQADEDFARQWAEIRRQHDELLEQSAWQRAVFGTTKKEVACTGEVRKRDPKTGDMKVVRKYGVVNESQQFESGLTVFMLKARKPEVYSEVAISRRSVQSDDESRLAVEAAQALRSLPDEQADKVREILEQAATPQRRLITAERLGEEPP